jgi:hypothetical protein
MSTRTRRIEEAVVPPMRKMWIASITTVLSLGLLNAAPAWAVDGGMVTPNSVSPGGRVTVVGNVPVGDDACPLPGIVILQGIGTWANPSGYEAGPYDLAGHFRVSGRLRGTIGIGPHVFMIRCAGRSEPLWAAAGAEIGGPAADAPFAVTDVTRDVSRTGPRSASVPALGLAAIAFGVTAMLVLKPGRLRKAFHALLRRP